MLWAICAVAQNIPEVPNPPRLVNDFANVLSPEQESMLEQKLIAYDDSTSTQFTIVLINTLDGYPVEVYAHELASKWGIGREKRNNGLLLLAAISDRKIRVEVGYGLEGAIPDVSANRIIREQIKPYFQKGEYYQGLDAAMDKAIALASGEYVNDYTKDVENPYAFLFVIAIMLLIFGVVMWLKFREVKRYAHLNNVTFWTAWEILNAAQARKRGQWKNFNDRGGGMFFPGGFWDSGGSSGGSSGGGFGGFGGGSFGGGGASGDW